MATRIIEYTVNADSIYPATEQHGGMQGDHNATELRFALSAELLSAIYENRVGTVYYRFDGYSGAGTMYSTAAKELFPESFTEGDEIELAYPLENALTRDGGNIRVYLVITDISKNEGVATERELYSFPALIRLKGIAGRSAYSMQYKGITGAELSAIAAAERAEKALSGFADSIDGKYDPESSNAQSGTAVAEAVNGKMDKFGEIEQTEICTPYGKTIVSDDEIMIGAKQGDCFLSSPYMPAGIYSYPYNGDLAALNVYTPDDDLYAAANKLYVDTVVGSIETALDSIIAIQETLIGGGE